MNPLEEIAAERERQKSVEGWTEQHDDAHASGEMAIAAACYAASSADLRIYERYVGQRAITFSDAWPWDTHWDKRGQHDERRSLVIAAALILAEIERLDRATGSQADG